MSEPREDEGTIETTASESIDDGLQTPGHAAADAAAEIASHPEFVELQDRYLRLAAEYDNYRKRTAREWNEHQGRAIAEVLREVLELGDNLERALAAPGGDEAGLRKGIELIAQLLQAKLRRFGVEPIAARGNVFDPARHEAVLVVETDAVPSQWVVDEVQPGYTLNGEVLRPARVTVAR